MLELASRVGAHDRAVHDGQWVNCDDFCFTVAPLTELYGKTLGLIGFGQIGLAFARIGIAMGMNVIAYNRSQLTAQRTDNLSYRDSLETIRLKGRDLERVALAEAVRSHIEHRVTTIGSRTIVYP